MYRIVEIQHYLLQYLKLLQHVMGYCTENSATHDAMKAEIDAADRLLTCHIFPKSFLRGFEFGLQIDT